MQIVIDIDENVYTRLFDNGTDFYDTDDILAMAKAIRKGTPIRGENSFIAVCNSDDPIIEKVKERLLDTLFIGLEDCEYCFEMTKIIKTTD